MAKHPPWLRFQAYVVGLPKTGSTSIATTFGNYRTGHEWQLRELIGCALQRQREGLSDDEFLRRAGPRLQSPALELDSNTCHYLYVNVLARQFPHAVFLHSIRDVRSWVTSLLDMVLRKRLARRYVQIPYSDWGAEYLAWLTDGAYDLNPADPGDDSTSLVPLLRHWGQHMRTMSALLPQGRSLIIRTNDIQPRAGDMAALVGVPAASMRTDLGHANQTPLRLDRFTTFDSQALRHAYAKHCAGITADLFPQQHAAWMAHCAKGPPQPPDHRAWDAHLEGMDRWVADAVQSCGVAVAN